MKFPVLLLVLFSLPAFGQFEKWTTQEVDTVFSAQLPGYPQEIKQEDYTLGAISLIQYSVSHDDHAFTIQRLTYQNIGELPGDLVALTAFYRSIGEDTGKELGAVRHERREVEVGDHLGILFNYFNAEDLPILSTQYFLIENHLYLLMYLNQEGLDLEQSDRFFNSMQLNPSPFLSQVRGQVTVESAYEVGYASWIWIPFLAIPGLVWFLISRAKRRNKTRSEL